MNKGQINTNLGQISINPDVIAFYVGIQAVECFGIVGMAAVSVTDGISRLLKRENLTKGISVKIEDNKLILDFHIIVAYGLSISAITQTLIETIQYKAEKFTGMEVKKINIFVEGVRIID